MNKRKNLSKRLSLLMIIGIILFGSCSKKEDAFVNRKVSFNSDWSFHLNDSVADKDTIGASTKWRTLNVPHDWSIEGKFDEKSPAGYGG